MRPSGLPADDYRKCCYSCAHCRITPNRGSGRCDLTEQLIKHIRDSVCKDWKDAELSQCNICGSFHRSLGAHLRQHGITVAQYKEMNGINRTSALSSKATSDIYRELAVATKKSKTLVKYRFKGSGTQGKNWSWRFEAIMHMKDPRVAWPKKKK